MNLSENINNQEINNKKIILDEKVNFDIKNILESKYIIEEYNSNDIPENYFLELMMVANDGFGIEMDIEDVKNHLLKSDRIFLLKIDGKIVGFSSLVYLKDYIYRYGTVIKKDFQGKGLYKKLGNTIFENGGKYFLRTQNKNVIKSLEKTFSNVIFGKNALDFMKENLSKDEIGNFMLKLGDKENKLDERGIFRNAYNGKMGNDSNVNHINNDFYKGFSAESGDSLLVVYFNNN